MTRRTAVLLVLLVLASGVYAWDTWFDADEDPCMRDQVLQLADQGMEELEGTFVAELEVSLPGAIDMVDAPWDQAGLWVATRDGRVVHLVDGEVRETLIDISDEVSLHGELGLLSIAISPGGSELFLSFTDHQPASRVERMPIDEGRPDIDSRVEVLRLEQPHRWHNGGKIEFGRDGLLYVAFGDGGNEYEDPDLGLRSADPSTWFGTILRLDVSEPGPGYAVPPDNPFVDGGGAPEVFAFGLRNPWRFAIDQESEELWIADVGHGCWEEINVMSIDDDGGADFGWPLVEGVRLARGWEAQGTAPIHVYGRDDGRNAITGGVVYRGALHDELVGRYLYSDYGDGVVRALRRVDDRVMTADLGVAVPVLVSFHQSADGDIYLVSLTDGVYRLAAG